MNKRIKKFDLFVNEKLTIIKQKGQPTHTFKNIFKSSRNMDNLAKRIINELKIESEKFKRTKDLEHIDPLGEEIWVDGVDNTDKLKVKTSEWGENYIYKLDNGTNLIFGAGNTIKVLLENPIVGNTLDLTDRVSKKYLVEILSLLKNLNVFPEDNTFDDDYY